MRRLLLYISLLLASACANEKAQPGATPSPSQSPSQSTSPITARVQYEDLVVGTGQRPLFNQSLLVRYTGTLPDGRLIDSNVDNGKPVLQFIPGRGEVIRGWDIGIGGGQGIPPMKVGGKRKLIVPPELGYGSQGSGIVPPNATLIFEVELVGIK
jgi:peptidylprolyl isomerase